MNDQELLERELDKYSLNLSIFYRDIQIEQDLSEDDLSKSGVYVNAKYYAVYRWNKSFEVTLKKIEILNAGLSLDFTRDYADIAEYWKDALITVVESGFLGGPCRYDVNLKDKKLGVKVLIPKRTVMLDLRTNTYKVMFIGGFSSVFSL